MCKKYLKVDVEKTISTILYIEVDEKDKRFDKFFEAKTLEELIKCGWEPRQALDPYVSEAVSETVDDYDWNGDEIDISVMNKCEEKEAKQYKVFQIPLPPQPKEPEKGVNYLF